MFKKWGVDMESTGTDNNAHEPVEETSEKPAAKIVEHKMETKKTNTILKGSKLSGNINVTSDLELSGDVEGNIFSEQNSNIVIKGTCKGNIETKGGSVTINGELKDGSITAGSDVRITGRCMGGDVKAKGRIFVDGEFNCKLEGNEVEIGSNARGKGQLIYKEFISIARGAKVEVQISQTQQELKLVKDTPEKKPEAVAPPVNEVKEDMKEVSKVK